MKESILPFFRPLEKIEKVSDFCNNGAAQHIRKKCRNKWGCH